MSIMGKAVAGTPLLTAISDATAEQWHVKTGKTAYIVGGKVTGTAYTPAMMDFDGSTSSFGSGTGYLSAGNAYTAVLRIKIPSFSGGGLQRMANITGLGGSQNNALLYVVANDHATVGNRGKLVMQTSATSGLLVLLLSNVVVTDNLLHTIFASYNGATGAATFYIDGADADDTGWGSRVLTSGTMTVGINGGAYLGRGSSGPDYVNGDLGFFGYREAYLSNWSDFMQADGSPKELDESTWTEWGAQPRFWNEAGKMDENLGSAGAMTKNGTTILGKGGNT